MNDLLIAQKVEGMIQYGYGALRHFPKSERHVLSQELRLSMWRILRLVIAAAKERNPRETLPRLDAELETLRRQIRLARELRALPIKQYEVWSRHLNEVGRMAGAWIKRARGQR